MQTSQVEGSGNRNTRLMKCYNVPSSYQVDPNIDFFFYIKNFTTLGRFIIYLRKFVKKIILLSAAPLSLYIDFESSNRVKLFYYLWALWVFPKRQMQNMQIITALPLPVQSAYLLFLFRLVL